MEYVIILLLQAFGVAFNAHKKIIELDKKYPDTPFNQIRDRFLKNERITFIGSGLIALFHLLCHVIVDLYYPSFREVNIPLFIADWSVPYVIGSFILAFLLGYFGQWLVYRIFGKAEKYLTDKTQ